jgi:hypothetical protein
MHNSHPSFVVGVLGLGPNGWLYVGKGGISWDFRSVREGRFEILHDQKGSIGKGMVVLGGFGK